jgi:hypothetical protein
MRRLCRAKAEMETIMAVETTSHSAKEYAVYQGLMQEAMVHLRHCQQQRAVYLNLYVLLYAAALGAYVTVNHEDVFAKDAAALSYILAGLVWVLGIVTIMRAERFTGHMIHDRLIARRLRDKLRQVLPALRLVYRGHLQLVARDEFRRSPLNVTKAVDSLIGMLGAATGGLPFVLIPPYNSRLIGVSIAVALTIIPVVVWRREVKGLEDQHRECCCKDSDCADEPPV